MDFKRWLRHAWTGPLHLRRAFPGAALATIEQAVTAAERDAAGQVRFAVEADLPLRDLWRNRSARERALAVFSMLGVWDTEHNNGVLIYVLLADRSVEIVADRGITGRVAPPEWEAICRKMEGEFRAGRFEQGAVGGIRDVGALLAAHFPKRGSAGNELPDAPVVLR